MLQAHKRLSGKLFYTPHLILQSLITLPAHRLTVNKNKLLSTSTKAAILSVISPHSQRYYPAISLQLLVPYQPLYTCMSVIHPCHVVHTFYWKWGLACSYDFKLGPIFNCGILVQITGQQVSTVIVPAQSNITCTHFTWNMLIHGMLYTFYKVGCAPDKVIWHWHYQWQCTASIIQHKKIKLIRRRRIFSFSWPPFVTLITDH